MNRVSDLSLDAWSQSIAVRWKPTLEYFKNRFELLEEIKNSYGSGSFRVDGEEVGLRFNDDLHELALRPNGVEFHVWTPNFDTSLAKDVLSLVIDRLKVEGTATLICEIQHLAALDADYAEARKSTVSRMLPFVDESLMPTDWSLLADGESPDKAVRFQTEFGIVDEREIRARISRRVGRVRSAERTLPSAWNELDLPAVAFFASTTASLQKRTSADASDIWESWQRILHNVETFLADILMGITDGKR